LPPRRAAPKLPKAGGRRLADHSGMTMREFETLRI
jgi:hypothetical protein